MMQPAGGIVQAPMAPPPQMDPQQMAPPPTQQQYQQAPPPQYQQAPPQYQQAPPQYQQAQYQQAQYQQAPQSQPWGMMPPPMIPQPQYLQAPQPPSMWGQQPSQIPPPVPMQPQPLQPQLGYAPYPAPIPGPAPASSDDEIRTLWIGEVQYYMDENYIANLFGQFGEIASVKLIRNKQTQQLEGYGFIEFASRATAEQVLAYNGQPMPGADQAFRLNWASKSAGERRADDGADYTIFVGDLASDVTDILLLETFKVRYSSIKGAKVVTDRATGRSKGYGFVRFADPNEQTRAMGEMNGVYCSTRPMRIGAAATKRDMGAQQQYPSTRASYQTTQGTQSESDPNNTTIFVGGLDPNVTEENLRQLFSQCGELAHVKIPVGKRCGFVQFASREKAEDALLTLNGTQLGAQNIRLSWGRSPSVKQTQQDPANGSYYGYGQGYEAYGYAQPPQDPNMYAYGAYPGYGYQQQQ